MLCRCWAYLTYTWVFLHLWMFSHFINMNGGKFLLFSLIYFMWVWRNLVMMGTVKVFETRNFTKNYSNCPWIPIKSEKSIWTKHLRLPNIILEDFQVFLRCLSGVMIDSSMLYKDFPFERDCGHRDPEESPTGSFEGQFGSQDTCGGWVLPICR